MEHSPADDAQPGFLMTILWGGHCTVVSSSSKTGILNTALKELYLHQSLPDLDVGKIYYWLKFGEDLSCASNVITAHLVQW